MAIPFLVFWVLVYLGRGELGRRGVVLSILIWLGLLIGFMYAGFSPYLFVIAQALLDIVLILVVFGGDIQIR